MSRPGENLARLYTRLGRRVAECDRVFWTSVDPGSRFFVPVLDHVPCSLEPDATAPVFRLTGGLVLRFPSLHRPGLPGGAYVLADAGYDFAHLSKRSRNYVRRGLENCSIRRLEAPELIREGLALNQDTDNRHGRSRMEYCDPRRWPETVGAFFASPGTVVTGAFHEGRLAAYNVYCVDAGWAYGILQMSRTECLTVFPNHAADFWLYRELFAAGVKGICAGPVALKPNPGLHQYKIRLGFEVRRYCSVVLVHPWLAGAVSSGFAASLLNMARRLRPAASWLDSAEILVTGTRVSAAREPMPAVSVQEESYDARG